MTLTPEGGAAIPVSVTTTRRVQGGAAIPVYGYMTAPTDGRPAMGGPAVPVRVLTAADLKENGGMWTLEGRPYAMPVYTAPAGVTVQGGPALAVYPVNAWPTVPVVPAFAPTDLGASLQLWLKANTGLFKDAAKTQPATTDGDAVYTWEDQSGNGRDVVQATAANRPLLKIVGGKNLVRFDGTNDFLARADGFPTNSDYSVYAVIKPTNLTANNNILSGSTNRAFSFQGTAYARTFQGGNVAVSEIASTTDWHAVGGILENTNSFGDTNFRGSVVFVNRAVAGTGGSTLVANADAAINIGAFGGNFTFIGDMKEIIVCNTTLTNAQRTNLFNYFATQHSITLPAPSFNYLICDGDSLTSGFGVGATENYPYQLEQLLGAPTWIRLVPAVANQTIQYIAANAAARTDTLFDTGGSANGKCIICAWGGTNDIAGARTAQQVYDDIVSFCSGRRTLGFKVVVLTILPRGTQVGAFNTARNTVNTNIRNNWATFANALADVAADSNIGDDGDNADLTYYQADAIHLNATGYGIVAPIVQAAIATL